MRKKSNLKRTIFALCIGALVAGCSNNDDEGSVALLKGYYKDSAVVGLPYTCGTQSGLTEEDGAFLFPAGQVCTFYLDRDRTIAIRSVPADALNDGVVIYEDDPIVGQILQSLDDDANPDNNIVIDPSVVDAVIADNGFNGFPSTTAEANALAEIIDSNNGSLGVVSAQEAEAHMLKSLLTEASHYQNCSGRTPEKSLTKVTLTEDNKVLLNDMDDGFTYSLDGGSLTAGTKTYTKSDSEGVLVAGAPIILNSASGTTSTLYSSEAQAEAATAEVCAFGDVTAPVITVAGDASSEIDLNSSFTDPVATSDDSNVTVTKSGEVKTDTVGAYELTYSAVDASGNIASDVVHVVTVTNTTPPVLTLDGASEVIVAHGSTYTDAGATALDAAEGALIPEVISNVNTGVVGDYSVTYNASDAAGNAATAVSRTVKVTDQTAPTISLTGDASIVIAHGSSYSDAGATAVDAVDGTLVPVTADTIDVNQIGIQSITYNVSDSANNAATAVTRTVEVTDQTAPTLSLIGDASLTVAHGSEYIDAGATAIDAVDGTLTPVKTGAIDTSIIGEQSVTYNVTDGANNPAIAVTRVVNVTDQTAPVITLLGNSSESILINTDYTDPGSVVADSVTPFLTATVTGSVDTSMAGTYTLTYSAMDAADNEAVELTREITVIDAIAIPVPSTYFDYSSFEFDGEVSEYAFNETNLSIREGALVGGSLSYTGNDSSFYSLKEGAWLEQTPTNFSVALSQLDSIALVNDVNQFVIDSVEDISSAIIDIPGSEQNGLPAPVVVPTGSLKATLKVTTLEDQYLLFGGPSPLSDLDTLLQSQCGTNAFDFVDAADFNFVAFTCGQESQMSGTLVGSSFDGTLTTDIGSWVRGNLPGSNIEGIIVTVDPIWTGSVEAPTESTLFAMKDNVVWGGQKINAGSEQTLELYNDVAHDAIAAEIVWNGGSNGGFVDF